MHKSKSRHKKSKSYREQQKNYIQNWSPFEPKQEYTALQDPHANYYFYNKSVNHHLRSLNHALNSEKNQKEKQKLKALLKPKIKLNLPTIRNNPPEIAIYVDDAKERELLTSSREIRKNSESQLYSGKRIKKRYHKNETELVINASKNAKQTAKLHRNSSKGSIQKLKTENNGSVDLQEIKTPKTSNEKMREQNIESVHMMNHKKFLQFISQKKGKILDHNETTLL